MDNSKPKVKEGICEYHLCKKTTKVYLCEYCGRYFCEDHIKPKPVLTFKQIQKAKEPLRSELEEIWRSDIGHPCEVYTPIFWKNIEEKEEKTYLKINEFLSKLKEKEIKSSKKDLMLSRIKIKRTPLLSFKKNKDFEKNSKLAENNPVESSQFSKKNKESKFNKLLDYLKKFSIFIAIFLTILTIGLIIYPELSINELILYSILFSGFLYSLVEKAKIFFKLLIILFFIALVYGLYYFLTNTIVYDIEKYKTEPITKTFRYVLRGKEGNINLTLYGGLKKYLSSLSGEIECVYILPTLITYCNKISKIYFLNGPTQRDIELYYLNEKIQYSFLKEIVEEIKKITDVEEDWVRIAISLVQNIPYDYDAYRKIYHRGRYPYEVLYDNKGVCGEKSRLLAFILKELGYGVVYFDFKDENHRAVGIKCPIQYSYRNTGYCFIETTKPSIPTYSNLEYLGIGKLTSFPEIIEISDGKSFDGILEEYRDAQEWEYLMSKKYLSLYEYSRWLYLVNKYGIKVTN